MKRNKNTEVIIQIIILAGIIILLTGGMLSGRVNDYIHPRYHIGIWLSIAILLLFVISLLTDINKARHNVNLKPYYLFAVPILITVIFPAGGIGKGDIVIARGNVSSDSASGSKVGNTADSYTSAEETIDYTDNPDNLLTSSYDTEDSSNQDLNGDTSSGVLEVTQQYDDMSEKYQGKEIDGAVVIEDDKFGAWFYDTYDYLKDFVGKRYQFLAQVYPSDEFGKNRFLAGRYIMVCCAADAGGYGIICENDISGSLKENEWITVTGTIQEYDYQGTKIPMLTDTVIAKAKAPKDRYVYYNYFGY